MQLAQSIKMVQNHIPWKQILKPIAIISTAAALAVGIGGYFEGGISTALLMETSLLGSAVGFAGGLLSLGVMAGCFSILYLPKLLLKKQIEKNRIQLESKSKNKSSKFMPARDGILYLASATAVTIFATGGIYTGLQFTGYAHNKIIDYYNHTPTIPTAPRPKTPVSFSPVDAQSLVAREIFLQRDRG